MRYEAVWYSHDGIQKGVIQSFTTLEYIKTQNAIGALVINMDRQLVQYDQFAVGDIFEVWREKGGVLELQNETAYFLQSWEFWTDEDGAEYIRLIADDANWLLDTAIVMAPAGDAKADKTAIPDNMMKAIVREQLGSLAAADRQKLNVAPDLGAAGSSITKAFAYRNVLDVCRKYATQRGKRTIFGWALMLYERRRACLNFALTPGSAGRITGAIPVMHAWSVRITAT